MQRRGADLPERKRADGSDATVCFGYETETVYYFVAIRHDAFHTFSMYLVDIVKLTALLMIVTLNKGKKLDENLFCNKLPLRRSHH